ncbi:unnamed protein product [Lactuca saligna]|uniref:Uncharacterized protein n=1 Tax=Lactuca saligna TaxID=75948 RepID=A0AA35V3F9_LACSI|nr:unnamed protein product [Lactuca saligna]
MAFVSCRFLVLFLILMASFVSLCHCTSNILGRKVASKSNITREKIVVDFCFKFHCNFPTGWEKCYCCTILKSEPCWVDRNINGKSQRRTASLARGLEGNEGILKISKEKKAIMENRGVEDLIGGLVVLDWV